MRVKPKSYKACLSNRQEYTVLEVYINKSSTWYRIEDDDLVLALHEANEFEIVSNHLPASWIIVFVEPGSWKLTTAKWANIGYWEQYFEFDEDARFICIEEKEKINSQSL